MKLTVKQELALAMIAGTAIFSMLFGGSRSGKTFLYVRLVVLRALKAPNSRHVILRFRLAHVKASIVAQTFPEVMAKCFPEVEYDINKGEMYATLQNGSEIWFGGLDDKERTEKILGMEFVTLYLNECSQIPWASVQMAYTRLAQLVTQYIGDTATTLMPRAFHDCNPPSKAHWTYKLFIKKVDPETGEKQKHPENYCAMKMNPMDNAENLAPNYLELLQNMKGRMQKRFWDGEFADANPNALFPEEFIDKNRLRDGAPPDMVRIVVAVDPSGAGDSDNADNDAIGIMVCGLGVDGRGYWLEDLTVKAGPKTWGRVAVQAYMRWQASCVCAEVNYGGAMVEMVIKTAAKELETRVAYREVHASRGKVVRAEPIGQLMEEDKIVIVGFMPELEEELGDFNTNGYVGDKSPNRADAGIWGMHAIFPSIGKKPKEPMGPKSGLNGRTVPLVHGSGLGWMRG